MFNRMSGHFDLQLPDLSGFDWPELTGKAADIRKLADDFRDTGKQLRELEDNRSKAKRADTAAFAEAIKAGKKDPGTKHTDKLEERVAAVTRRRDALRVVLSDRASELLDQVEERRSEWTAEAEGSLGKAEEAAEEARQALEAAEAEVVRHKQVLAFLEDPENYRPAKVAKEATKAPAAPKPKPAVSLIGATPGMRERANADAS